MVMRGQKGQPDGSVLFLGLLVILGVGCQEMGPSRAVSSSAGGVRTAGERRYTVLANDGRYWLVNPRREAFFSFGVCGVDSGLPSNAVDPLNPAYSAARIYSSEAEWRQSVIRQLDHWNVGNLGAWSEWDAFKQISDLPLTVTPVLHLGASAGFPWEDMWDPERVQYLQTMAKELIARYGNDERVIGYYSDNELGWRNGALFRYTLEHPASSRQRQVLVDQLERRYQGQWAALLRDFIPDGADSFASLRKGGTVSLRPGSRGIGAYRMFLTRLAERYYELASGAIRSADPGALFLGDRYASFYYRELVSAAGPWVDVISTNLKSAWTDGGQLDFFIKSLHGLSARPVIVSEVYMAAMENRSGNRNSIGEFPKVLTQRNRAAAIERMLQSLALEPAVVGVDWFQFYDQPPRGRAEGGDYNLGLVDLSGRPYEEVGEVLSELDLGAIHRDSGTYRWNRMIPVAPDFPMGSREPRMALQNWDRKNGLIPPSSQRALADLYGCWQPGMFYLGVYSMNHEEGDYYADRVVPLEDRMRFEVSFPTSALYIAKTLGSGTKVYHQGEPLDVELVEFELNFSGRTVMVMGIPFPLLQSVPLFPGAVISLSANLRGHGGFQVAAWSQSLTCSDR